MKTFAHPGRFAFTPRRIAALSLASMLAGASPAAWCWGNLLLLEPRPEATTLSVGASGWTVPRYPGGKQQSYALLPAFAWYSPTGLFASTEDGLGWNLSPDKSVQAGVRLWPQLGRSPDDDVAHRAGINTRVQQEAFVNVQAFPFLLLQSGLLHGSGRERDGMQFELGATSGIPIGGDLLAIGLAATYANHAHRQGYYGITPDDSARSGLPVTRFGNGWQDVNLTLSTEHKFDTHWRVDGQVVVARLVGSTIGRAVADRQQVAATVSLWYDF